MSPKYNASYLLYIKGHCKVWVNKQDVLRLQVRVCQLIVMENYEEKENTIYPLSTYVSSL